MNFAVVVVVVVTPISQTIIQPPDSLIIPTLSTSIGRYCRFGSVLELRDLMSWRALDNSSVSDLHSAYRDQLSKLENLLVFYTLCLLPGEGDCQGSLNRLRVRP